MDDVNRPEVEEDGMRAEALRRLKVRLTYAALPARLRDDQPSQGLAASHAHITILSSGL